MRAIILNKDNIKEVIQILNRGGVIAYPTETVYGLGCDASNKRAAQKIFQIKGREAGLPLPVLVSDLIMLRRYFKAGALSKKLIFQYWPGPLTLILDFNNFGRKSLAPVNNNGLDGAVRISANAIAQEIIKKLGKPLVSTSANVSGQEPALDSKVVFKYFKNKKNKPDIIIEGGSLKRSKGSTIVDARGGKLKIIRQGDLKP